MGRNLCPHCHQSIPVHTGLHEAVDACPWCGWTITATRGTPAEGDDEYRLAPPEELPEIATTQSKIPVMPRDIPLAPLRPSAASQGFEQQPFFGKPFIVVLASTALATSCLCPLSMFLLLPRLVLMMGGFGLIFGGLWWYDSRYRKLFGAVMHEEIPILLRGGLVTQIQMIWYVGKEPRLFGPPFLVCMLGIILFASSILLPTADWLFR